LPLIAGGDVAPDVDLRKLTDRDVIISPDGASVTLTLPASEMFGARLDNERTRVYDRQTRLIAQLTGRRTPNPETQARREAERQIPAAACANGIMQRAAEERNSFSACSKRRREHGLSKIKEYTRNNTESTEQASHGEPKHLQVRKWNHLSR
jgi:hypothetical protein